MGLLLILLLLLIAAGAGCAFWRLVLSLPRSNADFDLPGGRP